MNEAKYNSCISYHNDVKSE